MQATMASTLVIGIILGFLAYLVRLSIVYRYRAFGTSKRKDPRYDDVPGWPLIGNFSAIILNASQGLEWMSNMAIRVEPGFSLTLPGHRIVDVSKPEWIEHVQKTNFYNYVKGRVIQMAMGDVFGQGIFPSDGEQWKRSRQASSHIFNVTCFKNIMMPSLDKSVERLTQFLKESSEEAKPVDFCNLFHRFTLESFVHMTFGTDLDLIRSTKQDSGGKVQKSKSSPERFAQDFDFVQNQIDFRLTLLVESVWQALERYYYPLRQRMNSARENLLNYAYSLIDERQAELEKAESKDTDHPSDLLGVFIRARDEKGVGLNRSELKDAVLNLIIAGRDTTAQALSWQFYHLIMNPAICEKLRQESQKILQEDPSGRVTYENYKRFIYTQSVIFETLRLHPSVPKNIKFAVKDDQIPGGPFIEAGDMVRWSDWQMGRNVTMWGADCGQFRPDRWIDESGNLKQFGAFKFHAFNGGPRLCLGMNLAMLEMVAITVELLNKFEFEFDPGWLEQVPKTGKLNGVKTDYPEPKYRASLTLPMENPMMVLVRPSTVSKI